MNTIDDVLESGEYRDRRGRTWGMCRVAECSHVGDWWGFGGPVETMRHVSLDQMRRMIERDQHRGVCPGIIDCYRHPVPSIVISRLIGKPPPDWSLSFEVNWGDEFGGVYDSLPEAMDGARELAVKS